jgi:hypothetical protein
MKYMKTLFLCFFYGIICMLESCSKHIKTSDEAIKFLESHEWDAGTCCIRASGGNEYKMSTGVSFTFKNGKVSENDDQPCSYTISTENYPEGSIYVLRFNDPRNVGTECFRLFPDGSAHCYPEQGQEGVFADFDDNK